MTGTQLRHFRKRLGMTQVQFAAYIKAAPNTVARWERGSIGMSATTKLALELLMQTTDLTDPTLPRRKR